MMPTMEERKIASSCHALRGTPDGAGMNQRSTPVAMEISSGVMAAPCSGGGAAGAGAGTREPAEAEAATGGRARRGASEVRGLEGREWEWEWEWEREMGLEAEAAMG
jgi:hypothetical protein